MWVMDQFHGYKKRKEGLETYARMVENLFKKRAVSDAEAMALKTIEESYGLSHEKTRAKKIELVKHVYRQSIEDKKLSENELSRINSLLGIFSLKKGDIEFNQDELIKYSSINNIAKGDLPNITEVADRIGVLFSDDEVINGVEGAELKKLRKVTQRVNYGGFSSSVRIMKGLRYRTGSFNVQRIHAEVLALEDKGIFWISNQRLGFKGGKMNFAIEWRKVASFQLCDYGLMIFKEGKETPYILNLKDYDVMCALASYYLNPREETEGQEEALEEELSTVESLSESDASMEILLKKPLMKRWYIKIALAFFILCTFLYSFPILCVYGIYYVWKKVTWPIALKLITTLVLASFVVGAMMAMFSR